MADPSPVADLEQTEVGSYFVANYPPFSIWTPEAVATDARVALDSAPASADTPLGLYLHIPFCRKRCHFCYFRVYTDKNAREVEQYLDLLGREWELYADRPAIAGRPFKFVYFGGGTPSFLSTRQLESLVSRVTANRSWSSADEITFECEPGTITKPKLAAIRGIGVTRLSLGVENFDDRILELNGRAHRSPEIERVYREARDARVPADQHRSHRRHAGRDRRELDRLHRQDARTRAGQHHHLPDGAAVQHHHQQGSPAPWRPLRRSGGRMGDEAALGGGGVRGVRARRLYRRQRLHGGEGSGEDAVPLSRSIVAGRRHDRPRRRLVRPRQRRPPAERRHLGRRTATPSNGATCRSAALTARPTRSG